MKHILITAILILIGYHSYSQQQGKVITTNCWITHYKGTHFYNVIPEPPMAIAIKPKSYVTIINVPPGEYLITFLDTDKGDSHLRIKKCYQGATLNIYQGEQRVTIGANNCNVNYLTPISE